MIHFEGVTAGGTSPDARLRKVSVRVAAGNVYALLSESREALALVIDLLLGRRLPDDGHVRIDSVTPAESPMAARRLVGLVVDRGLDERRSARLNAEAVLTVCGIRHVSPEALEDAFRRAALPDRLFDRPAAELRPRDTVSVWLALAALRDTPVVLCDGLGSALGGSDARHVARLLRASAASGRAVLIIDSDPVVARLAADRWGTIRRGRLVPGSSDPTLSAELRPWA